jgi:hypothetical protein
MRHSPLFHSSIKVSRSLNSILSYHSRYRSHCPTVSEDTEYIKYVHISKDLATMSSVILAPMHFACAPSHPQQSAIYAWPPHSKLHAYQRPLLPSSSRHARDPPHHDYSKPVRSFIFPNALFNVAVILLGRERADFSGPECRRSDVKGICFP